METPVRSNVMPVSNVAVRAVDEKGVPVSRMADRAYLGQVRGGAAVRKLVEAVLGRSTYPPDWVQEQRVLEILTRAQYAQRIELMKCRCGRVVFGPVRVEPNGVRWCLLQEVGRKCRCESEVDHA